MRWYREIAAAASAAFSLSAASLTLQEGETYRGCSDSYVISYHDDGTAYNGGSDPYLGCCYQRYNFG